MSDAATTLFQQALNLTADERYDLAQRLLDSTEDDALPDDPEWRAELDRRLRSVADGTAELIPWETARENILAELARRRSGRAEKAS